MCLDLVNIPGYSSSFAARFPWARCFDYSLRRIRWLMRLLLHWGMVLPKVPRIAHGGMAVSSSWCFWCHTDSFCKPCSRGCVMTLQGLSGTGKGTTVDKLKEKLPNAQTWSDLAWR